MKWRMCPHLDTQIIKDKKYLLIGWISDFQKLEDLMDISIEEIEIEEEIHGEEDTLYEYNK